MATTSLNRRDSDACISFRQASDSGLRMEHFHANDPVSIDHGPFQNLAFIDFIKGPDTAKIWNFQPEVIDESFSQVNLFPFLPGKTQCIQVRCFNDTGNPLSQGNRLVNTVNLQNPYTLQYAC